MVAGGFSWFFIIIGWLFIVTGRFSCFFLFQVRFSWIKVRFNDSMWIFMVIYSSGWFFMIPGVFHPKRYLLDLYLGPTIPPARPCRS